MIYLVENLDQFSFLLGNSAKLSLDHFMPDIQINQWIETFHQYKFDKLTFEPLFKRALLILKDAWLRCLKEDIDRFTAAYYLTSSPSQSVDGSEEEEEEREEEEEDEAEEEEEEPTPILPIPKKQVPRTHSGNTQIKISTDIIYIKRPWVNRFLPSAPSERRERFITALDNAMSEEERKRLHEERLERLRKNEENRKKALRAARERQKQQTNGKGGSDGVSSEKTAQSRRTAAPGLYIDRLLPTKNATLSKDSQRLILNHFQRYIRSSKTPSGKLENKLSLTFEIAKVMK
jgi:hypothetical protein